MHDNEKSLTIKEILESDQFTQLIKDAVRSTMREELKEVKESITRLTEQVERNEAKILSLEIEEDAKVAKIKKLEKSLEKQRESITILQNKSNEAEQYSRRSCLRVFGVPESREENTDEIMLQLAKEKLGINLRIEDIERSHRIGAPRKDQNNANIRHSTQTSSQKQPSSTTTSSSTSSTSTTSTSWASKVSESGRRQDNRGRPIIIKLASYRVRQSILKSRRRLKNTGISINEDLTKPNYDILKQTRSSSNVTAAWSQDGRIFVALASNSGTNIKKLVSSIEEARKL